MNIIELGEDNNRRLYVVCQRIEEASHMEKENNIAKEIEGKSEGRKRREACKSV
jgi:hypothetical protein